MLKNLTILLMAAATLAAILAVFLWWTRPPQAATDIRAAPCGMAWRIVESADPSKEYNELHSISALSPEDIWAVGTFGTEQYALTLTEHWDGVRWIHVP